MLELIKNEPRVSTVIIAKNTNNAYESVRDLVKRYYEKLKLFGKILTTDFKSALGKEPKRVVLLNEQQAYLLLTFMRNNEIVINFKVKLVQEFFKMREKLNNQSNIKKTYVNLSDTKVREAFYIAYDGKCYYSKEKLSKTNFHIDHIQPKSKGGEDILSNLVLCIPEINLVKADNYDKEFVNKHQNIVNRYYAPKVEAILNLSKNEFDVKYLLNGSVMNKLEDLYGREVIKEFYSKLIPNLNYKKSQRIESKTIEYFIKNGIVKSEGRILGTTRVYEAYLNFCMDNKISPYNKIRFFRIFRNIKGVPKINYLKMAMIDGKKQRYFEDLEIVL